MQLDTYLTFAGLIFELPIMAVDSHRSAVYMPTLSFSGTTFDGPVYYVELEQEGKKLLD